MISFFVRFLRRLCTLLLGTWLAGSTFHVCLAQNAVLSDPVASVLPEAPSSSLTVPSLSSTPPPAFIARPAIEEQGFQFPAAPLALGILTDSAVTAIDTASSSSLFAWGNPQADLQHGDTPHVGAPASQAGQQPKRILGLMPNYRSVSSGTIPPPPTFKQNFKTATRQSFDYSSFVFLAITSATAYAQDSHPSLDSYNGGDAVFWAYIWRGFIDKTDGTYLSAFILPTLLREDTRYYAMGTGSKWRRLGYSASRVAIARTYGGRTTPNLAGLGGKVAAQAISPYYYPPGTSSFGVLATKFAYAVARDMGFTVFREFYPDIAVHALHRNP